MSTAIAIKAPFTYSEEVLVQVKNDGYIEFCNHANAEHVDVDFGRAEFDSKGDLDWNDNWQKTLCCDDCGKWFNELDQEWVEG